MPNNLTFTGRVPHSIYGGIKINTLKAAIMDT